MLTNVGSKGGIVCLLPAHIPCVIVNRQNPAHLLRAVQVLVGVWDSSNTCNPPIIRKDANHLLALLQVMLVYRS